MNMSTMYRPQHTVHDLFMKSRIDYDTSYLTLYSAYNAWYREVTGQQSDQKAFAAIKQKSDIWNDALQDRCMSGLRSLLRRLYVLTNHRPVQSHTSWLGSLEDEMDWRGLIDFWYALRCTIVHGNDAVRNPYHDIYVKLAYETLFLFMTEIVGRLAANAGDD